MCQKVVPVTLAVPKAPASPISPLFQISALANLSWGTDRHSALALTLTCESHQRRPQHKSGLSYADSEGGGGGCLSFNFVLL